MVSKIWSKISNVRIILGLLFLGVIILMWTSDLHKCLTFSEVKANTAWLSLQVAQHYWWTVFLYIITYVVVVVCSLPGVALMSIIGGFLFGWLPALFYINIAVTIGGTVFFLLVRYLIGAYVQARYATKLVNFNRRIERQGWIFLLMVRCIPLIPFSVINILAGLTKIPLSTFIWTTSVGVIPTSLIFAYTGRQLTAITQLRDIFSVQMVGALLLLLVLVLVPILINKYRRIF